MSIQRFDEAAASPWLAGIIVSIAGYGAISSAAAQTYPSKPIRLITGSAGGGVDFMARLVAQGISGPLGQPVIVENRGAGVVQGEIVTHAPPDGYTLLAAGSIFFVQPSFVSTPYDLIKDFAPITLVSTQPSVLVVHPSLPAHSVKELISLARARPGELNYAANAPGSSFHLAGELFKAMAGVNIVAIPYKGGGPALNDILGGQVQLMFATPAPAAPQIKSGRLRALATTSITASALFPGLPTVSAAGLPGYEAVSMSAILAPPATAPALIDRLNREIVRVLNQTDVKQKLLASAVETVGSTPQELAVTMKAYVARWGKVIKDAGIKAD